jgi:hypothetical protein
MPAFKLQPEIVLVMKRGHKARGYVPVLTTYQFDKPRKLGVEPGIKLPFGVVVV